MLLEEQIEVVTGNIKNSFDQIRAKMFPTKKVAMPGNINSIKCIRVVNLRY